MVSNTSWNCSVLGWGPPTDPRTYSGYARQVTRAIADQGALRRQYSLKQLGPLDVFRGAIKLERRGIRPRLAIDRSWMWSDRGTELLNRRLNRMIRRYADHGDFLQFGTLCEPAAELGRHFVCGDMTIPQAHRAGQFAVAHLSDRQIAAAMDVQRRVLRGAHHIFAWTQWVRRSYIEDYGIPPQKVTVVYTGANMRFPADLKATRNPHQILFVGIDWERKGGPQLVEGFRLLRRRLPDAELVIVGCRPDVDCSGVRVVGFLKPGDAADERRLAKLYLESSCFALMSDFEPLGIVMIEAFNAALPVVAYDSGSRAEIIRNGESGLLCPDREPQTIADALFEVLSDRTLHSAMAQEAKRLASSVFTWEIVVDKIREVLSRPTLSETSVAMAASAVDHSALDA